MPFHYFIKIANLPSDLTTQDKVVKLTKYLVKEGQEIKVGSPIATVENKNAVFQVESNGKGFINKLIFDIGTFINLDEPIALVNCDGEDIPYHKPVCSIRVIKKIPQDHKGTDKILI